MLPTPYAHGVGNTCSVDDVLYAVGSYSVGDILWTSRLYTVGYIQLYVVGTYCGNHDLILWVTHAVDVHCGRHSVYCGSHKCMCAVGDVLWTTAIYDVGNI